MMLFCIGDFCLQQSYLIYPGPGVTCFGFFLRNPFSWFRLIPWGDIDELHAIKDITINLSWLTKKIVCQAELSRHSSSLERDELILFLPDVSALWQIILRKRNIRIIQYIWFVGTDSSGLISNDSTGHLRSRSPLRWKFFEETPSVYSNQESLYPRHPLLQSIMIDRTNSQMCL